MAASTCYEYRHFTQNHYVQRTRSSCRGNLANGYRGPMMSAEVYPVNCGVNVREKDRDQIKADHPSHIGGVRQAHHGNGEQDFKNARYVNNSATREDKRRKHRNHGICFEEVAEGGKKKHEANTHASGQGEIMEMKEICN